MNSMNAYEWPARRAEEKIEREISSGKIYYCRIHIGPDGVRQRHSVMIASKLSKALGKYLFASDGESIIGTNVIALSTATGELDPAEFSRLKFLYLNEASESNAVICVVHSLQRLSQMGMLTLEKILQDRPQYTWFIFNADRLENISTRILSRSEIFLAS
jgi:hypothetical protein